MTGQTPVVVVSVVDLELVLGRVGKLDYMFTAGQSAAKGRNPKIFDISILAISILAHA